jgi:acyl-CoA synthetase (NDP forming)
VLQSGALASAVMQFTRSRAIGVSLLTSMGNEAIVTAADVIEYLLGDEATKVIALFLESIRDPGRFVALADRALAAGKPLVALKVGRTPAGRAAALAHTGAVAGDDAVVAAVQRQHGVIRVDSLRTAHHGRAVRLRGPLAGRRMGVVTASGGACDIIADRAADEGIEIPDFAPATVEAIAAVLPSFAAVRNPLDTTGFMLADPAAAAGDPGVVALNALIDDPGVDFIFNAMALPAAQPPDPTLMNRRLAGAAAARQRSHKPIVHFTNVCTDVSLYARGLLAEHGLHVLGGIELGLRASATRWPGAPPPPTGRRSPGPAKPKQFTPSGTGRGRRRPRASWWPASGCPWCRPSSRRAPTRRSRRRTGWATRSC